MACAAASLWQAGCAGGARAEYMTSAETAGIAAGSGWSSEAVERDSYGLLLGELELGAGSILGDAAWTDGPKRRVFERFTPDGSARVARVYTPVEIGPAWLGATDVAEIDEGGDAVGRSIRLARTEEGLFTLVTDSGSVRSEFEPGALFLPKQLAFGEVVERSFRVAASGGPVGKGSDGTGTVRVEGIGSQVVVVPAGRFQAGVAETRLSMKIGPARIVVTRRLWVDPVFGVVAERGKERVTVFGVPFRDDEWVAIAEQLDD